MRRALPVVLALTTLSLAPAPASACGGLFCSSPSQPVNQTAERIVFSRDAGGNVTAIIEIRYEGTAANFAWLIPVAGDPTVGVSSTAVFDRLQQSTNPTYQLTTTVEGSCSDTFRGGGGPFTGGAADASAAASDAGVSHVTVVDSGAVGPYEFVVIHVDPTASPLAAVAIDWLNTNAYYVPSTGSELLEPYLSAGMNLLAFRLHSGADVGSIRPVTIGFGTGVASIPIRPTAVAAQDDMGVMVWVLGPSRAIPVEYASLELDEALINWLSPSSTYGALVTRAADEAGGQGFVTEFAGAASPFGEVVWPTYQSQGWDYLRSSDPTTTPDGSFLQNTVYQLGGLDGLRDAIGASVPLPSGVTLDQLMSCISCYYPYDANVPGFDRAAFIGLVDAQVIEPMRVARQLVTAQPEITRFYTTMSAAEMTRDPSFDFNPDLPDVSNVHTATRVIECSPSLSQSEAPWRVQLGDGRTIRGEGTTWPFAVDSALPANEIVRRVGTSGTGAVIANNSATIQAAIDAHNATVPQIRSIVAQGGGGCAVGGRGEGVVPLLVIGAALAGLGRRRARR